MPRTTIRSEDITDLQVKTADIADSEVTTLKMAVDPRNASNLSSGSVPLAQLGNVDFGPTEDDIAVLGFQVAAASDLAKYSLRDQIVDTFQDASGVDASASTSEVRNATGKYFFGGTQTVPTVTGGTITTDGDYTVHKFTANGNLIADTAQSYEVLVVAGGGGGGRRHGGGGGAGGLIWIDGYSVTAATHAIVVGAGGAGSTSNTGASQTSGNNSTFMALTAVGGGVGANDAGNHNFNTGGSGGGSDDEATHGGLAAQPSTNDGHAGSGFGMPGYGYTGMTPAGTSNSTGKGGGGAGQTGGYGASFYTGGYGRAYDIMVTGTDVYYAGGGGGGDYNGAAPAGAGGLGGGGAGAAQGQSGTDGTDGLGGGGGGQGSDTGKGGDGGNGVVILRRPTAITTYGNMTLVSTATTAEAGTTATGDLVILYTPYIGSTVLNTNLKAYVSRDNGTTYTQATLVGKGSYSGTTQIASVHDLDISAQPAGVAMRWKVETLVQSASLVTRLNGVSLGWA